MIEQAYNAQIAAHWHLRYVWLGMIKAGVRDGDVGLWPSLWREIELEARREVIRAKANVQVAYGTMTLGENI